MSKPCPAPGCKVDLTGFSEGGIKRHFTTAHKGYDEEQLRQAGVVSSNPVAKTADAGRSSIGEVVASAPETESAQEDKRKKREPKQTPEDKERERMVSMRPVLIAGWKRRLKAPYLIFAKMTGDPGIALSEEEAQIGAEMHADLMIELGWIRAGKMLAIFDVGTWHLATFLTRSTWGKDLLDSFTQPEAEKKQNGAKVN